MVVDAFAEITMIPGMTEEAKARLFQQLTLGGYGFQSVHLTADKFYTASWISSKEHVSQRLAHFGQPDAALMEMMAYHWNQAGSLIREIASLVPVVSQAMDPMQTIT